MRIGVGVGAGVPASPVPLAVGSAAGDVDAGSGVRFGSGQRASRGGAVCVALGDDVAAGAAVAASVAEGGVVVAVRAGRATPPQPKATMAASAMLRRRKPGSLRLVTRGVFYTRAVAATIGRGSAPRSAPHTP
jgi:hypothetical protein